MQHYLRNMLDPLRKRKGFSFHKFWEEKKSKKIQRLFQVSWKFIQIWESGCPLVQVKWTTNFSCNSTWYGYSVAITVSVDKLDRNVSNNGRFWPLWQGKKGVAGWGDSGVFGREKEESDLCQVEPKDLLHRVARKWANREILHELLSLPQLPWQQ